MILECSCGYCTYSEYGMQRHLSRGASFWSPSPSSRSRADQSLVCHRAQQTDGRRCVHRALAVLHCLRRRVQRRTAATRCCPAPTLTLAPWTSEPARQPVLWPGETKLCRSQQ